MKKFESFNRKRFFNNYLGMSQRYTRYTAFTLSEVLIAITVIGVVAAMTIPPLLINYQKNQTIEQLKSTFSVLNQAFDSARIDYGEDANSWSVDNSSRSAASASFAQNYLLPYLKTSRICGNSSVAECVHLVGYLKNETSPTKTYYQLSGGTPLYSFALLNGAIVGVDLQTYTNPTLSGNRIQIYFDVNGKNGPNIMGKDGFMIELGSWSGDKNKFLPYAWSLSASRTSYMTADPPNDCNKTNGNGLRCFALIYTDKWKIADDYPW